MALTPFGPLTLKSPIYRTDYRVIDSNCTCPTCELGEGISRAGLATMLGRETTAAHAVTLHNLCYMVRTTHIPVLLSPWLLCLQRWCAQSTLMQGARDAILADRYPQYLIDFFWSYFGHRDKFPLVATSPVLTHVSRSGVLNQFLSRQPMGSRGANVGRGRLIEWLAHTTSGIF